MSTTSTRVSFRYLLFKFWRAILSLFAGDIFFFQLCKSQYWYRTKFYFTFPESRLDHAACSDERWYWQLWTILFYLSLLPGATPYRLPSRSSTLDPPKRATVLLDNFWHIKNRQSSDFFVPKLCGFPWNFLVLLVTDSCLLPEPLIRTHSDSITPKNFCLYILQHRIPHLFLIINEKK